MSIPFHCHLTWSQLKFYLKHKALFSNIYVEINSQSFEVQYKIEVVKRELKNTVTQIIKL